MYWTLIRASETRILWLCVSAGTTELRQSCLSHWGARPCSLPKMLTLSPGTPSSSGPCPNPASQKPRTFPGWADELVKPNWVLRRWEKLQWKPGHPTPNLGVLFCWKGHNIPKRKAINSYCTRQRIVYFPPPVLRRKCNIYQGSNNKLEKFHSGPKVWWICKLFHETEEAKSRPGKVFVCLKRFGFFYVDVSYFDSG